MNHIIFPISSEQLDKGLDKYIKMLNNSKTVKDLLTMKQYTLVLVNHLQNHNDKKIATILYKSYLKEIEKKMKRKHNE